MGVNLIELPIGKSIISMLPYESHIESILSGNNLSKRDYYWSMIDIEGIILNSSEYKERYDFFIGRNLKINSIYSTFISRSVFFDNSDVLNYIISSLKKEEYCYLAIESSEISKYINYKGCKMIHNPLVCGINLETMELKISDFFDFKHYSNCWVPINEFMKGFFSIQNYCNDNILDDSETWVLTIENISLRRNKISIHDSWSKEGSIFFLESYLKGEILNLDLIDSFDYLNKRLNNIDKSVIKKRKSVYGIQVYQLMIEYLKNFLLNEDFKPEIKNLAILKSHFVILEILNVDYKNYYYIEEGKNRSQQLLLLGIKYNHTNNKDLIIKMIGIVNRLKELDKIIVNNIISCIKRGNNGL